MSFIDAVKNYWTKYATFTGRARRSEYWYAFLFLALAQMIVGAIWPGDSHGNESAASNVFSIICFLPSLAIGARRLHDTGRSGKQLWWMLLPIVGWIILIVYLIEDSKPGANEYGDPVK